MPIHVMSSRNERVQIPSHALAVSISGAVQHAELDVRATAEQQVVRVTRHAVMLPHVAGPVIVGVRAVGVPRFDAGTEVFLTIAHDNPSDADPVEVQFDPIDVSGDTGMAMASLTPQGSRIEIRLSAVADVPLSPLGAAARNSARKAFGRGTPRPGGSVLVALDGSASMRRWFADGSAANVTDIVVGVAAAIGLSEVSAAVVGAQVTPVPVAEPGAAGALAEAVRRVEPRWSAGARWSALGPQPLTVACTDMPTTAVRQRFPVLALTSDMRLADVLNEPRLLDGITAHLVKVLA